MAGSDPNDYSDAVPGQSFATTHWSLVLAAGRADSPQAAAALEKLCRSYWYPLYAFVRREGHGAEEAQDLTQGFFARLVEKNYLAQVAREKGKFRSFLLAALKHFLCDEHDKAQALKRGGGAEIVSFDELDAEQRYQLEPVDGQTPESIFERRWALTVLERAVTRLRASYVADGTEELYEALKVFHTGETAVPSYTEVARCLGLSESAVKSAIHRLRRRYREFIREEIAHTVMGPAEIDEEIRHLIAVMGR